MKERFISDGKNDDKKEEQELVNILAMDMYDRAMKEYYCVSANYLTSSWTRLRACTAWVLETDDFYFLRSYSTIVAVIEKSSDCMADVLRKVYGYTATSAQHIRKFEKDYGTAKWGCHGVLVAR